MLGFWQYLYYLLHLHGVTATVVDPATFKIRYGGNVAQSWVLALRHPGWVVQVWDLAGHFLYNLGQ
jgi:hypothetical protein